MMNLRSLNFVRQLPFIPPVCCSFHTSTCLSKDVAGRYRSSLNRNFPLTYEMAFPPEEIAKKKGYNSFNTAQLVILIYIMSNEVQILAAVIRKELSCTKRKWDRIFHSKH